MAIVMTWLLITFLSENKKELEEKMNLLIEEISKTNKERGLSENVPSTSENESSKKRKRSVLVAKNDQEVDPEKKQKRKRSF